MSQYVNGILPVLATRKQYSYLKTVVEKLRKTDANAADHLDDLLNDLTGVSVLKKGKKGDAAKVLDTISSQSSQRRRAYHLFQLRQLKKQPQSINNKAKQTKHAMAFAIEGAPNAFMSTLYATLLAAPKSAFKNGISPITNTVPMVLGLSKNPVMTAQIAADSFRGLGRAILHKGRKSSLVTKAQELGLHAKDMGVEQQKAMTGAIVEEMKRESKTYAGIALGRKALDKFNDTAMYVFKQGENTARAGALGIAETLTERAVKNPTFRRNLIEGIHSDSAKRQLANAETPAEFEKALASFLNSETHLTYDALHKSRAARGLGPALSTFSKWPQSSIGKGAHGYYHGHNKMLMSYLGAPFVAAKVWDTIAEEEGLTDHPVYANMVGDLSEWTMASAFKADQGILKGAVAQFGELTLEMAAKIIEQGSEADYAEIMGAFASELSDRLGPVGVVRRWDDFIEALSDNSVLEELGMADFFKKRTR